jgi:hypothetical protein
MKKDNPLVFEPLGNVNPAQPPASRVLAQQHHSLYSRISTFHISLGFIFYVLDPSV